FFQAEDGIRDFHVTGVQTCALPIFKHGEVNRAANGTIDRTHLKPTGARPIVRAGHEIEILAAGIEGRRDRIGESVRDLMALLFKIGRASCRERWYYFVEIIMCIHLL